MEVCRLEVQQEEVEDQLVAPLLPRPSVPSACAQLFVEVTLQEVVH